MYLCSVRQWKYLNQCILNIYNQKNKAMEKEMKELYERPEWNFWAKVDLFKPYGLIILCTSIVGAIICYYVV